MSKFGIFIMALVGTVIGTFLAAIIIGTIFYWLWPYAKEIFGIFNISTPSNLSWGGWVCFTGMVCVMTNIFKNKKKE